MKKVMKFMERQKSLKNSRKKGHVISEKTVGNYMREMHIKAHYIKPRTRTTISKDFSKRLKNILKRDFDPSSPDAGYNPHSSCLN